MIERLRHRRALAPAVGRRIVFVEPVHRLALLAAAGRVELAADRDGGGLVGDVGRGAFRVQTAGRRRVCARRGRGKRQRRSAQSCQRPTRMHNPRIAILP